MTKTIETFIFLDQKKKKLHCPSVTKRALNGFRLC